ETRLVSRDAWDADPVETVDVAVESGAVEAFLRCVAAPEVPNAEVLLCRSEGGGSHAGSGVGAQSGAVEGDRGGSRGHVCRRAGGAVERSAAERQVEPEPELDGVLH